MANHAPLNNVDHKNLRVVTTRGAAYGDAVMSALTFPAEFRDLQACYPIVFAQDGNGGYDALALLGFEQGGNPVLGPNGVERPSAPPPIQRRVRTGGIDAEALFLTYGGTSESLERISSVLRTIHEGLAASRAFTGALVELE